MDAVLLIRTWLGCCRSSDISTAIFKPATSQHFLSPPTARASYGTLSAPALRKVPFFYLSCPCLFACSLRCYAHDEQHYSIAERSVGFILAGCRSRHQASPGLPRASLQPFRRFISGHLHAHIGSTDWGFRLQVLTYLWLVGNGGIITTITTIPPFPPYKPR